VIAVGGENAGVRTTMSQVKTYRLARMQACRIRYQFSVRITNDRKSASQCRFGVQVSECSRKFVESAKPLLVLITNGGAQALLQ
jgi:hypothetical protein